MKIVSVIARYLLGLIFTVFGLNGFLNFIHQPPPSKPTCSTVLCRHQRVAFCRVLLRRAVDWWAAVAFRLLVPLALTVLAAELYNILAFHLTLAPATIAPALVASVLWVLVFLQYRSSFNGILAVKPAVQE